ncbi:hypothetical protein ACOMHN_037571 [Nucella lapillus]
MGSPSRSRSRSPQKSKSKSRSPSSHSRSRSRSFSRSRSRSRSRSKSRSRSRSRSRTPSTPERRYGGGGGSREDTGVRVGTRIHVGSLSSSTSTRDIQEEFGRFGDIIDMWMPRTQPAIAFVVYRHREDAAKAIKRMDGETLHSRRIRVTLARPRNQAVRGGAFNPNLRCYQCGKRGHFSRDCRTRQWSPNRETRRERYDREHTRRDSPRHSRRRSSSSSSH